MKIGILSDSHKKVDLTKKAVEKLKKEGAQYLVHAGDLEIEENLKVLKDSGLTYISVFGNNDSNLIQYQNDYFIKKEPYYFKIKDIKFKLMHLPYYMTPDSDVVIYGHTHNFEEKMVKGRLFLNPGEVCARNKNLTECALLHIEQEQYTVKYFFKEPHMEDWNSKIKTHPKSL